MLIKVFTVFQLKLGLQIFIQMMESDHSQVVHVVVQYSRQLVIDSVIYLHNDEKGNKLKINFNI